jgi:Flp pilus assembly protein TadD
VSGETRPSPTLQPFLRRRGEIEALLERPGAGEGERERVRQEIVRLFRDTEAALEELAAFKESIRPLVDRYKASYAAEVPAARTPRADHLGSSTHVERAWSALAGGQHAAAAREATRALELAPGDAYAETLLGWAHAELGDLAVSYRILAGVVKREPEDGLARACLGLVLLLGSDYEEADRQLLRVIQESEDRKALLYATLFRGQALAGQGLHEEARLAFGRAIELAPGLIEAYWQLGRSHYVEGDLRLAADAWRRGSEAGRFSVWGERCGDALDRLRTGEPVSID